MTHVADLPRDIFDTQFTELLKAVPPEDRHEVLADLRHIALFSASLAEPADLAPK